MLFDSTLRNELSKSFGATLVVILTIVLTMMLIRTLGQAAGGAVAPQDVVLLMGYVALGHLPTMLNLSLFIAVVATLSRQYRESEMTIWFASGVGLMRFVRPVFRVGVPTLLVVAALVLVLWPWGNRNSATLKERYERRSDLARVAPGQFQTSSDGKRVFFIERDSEDERTGRNVFILSNIGNAESVTSARSGNIQFIGDDRFLVLHNGQRNEIDRVAGDKTVARFDQYEVQIGERMTSSPELPPKARNTVDLLLVPTPKNQGELTWRIGLVLAGANLLLLGIGLSATNPRRATNWNLLFALLAFVVYFNLLNLSQAWVANGRMSMGTALLAIHGGLFVVAMALLWWRDHATTFGLRARR